MCIDRLGTHDSLPYNRSMSLKKSLLYAAMLFAPLLLRFSDGHRIPTILVIIMDVVVVMVAFVVGIVVVIIGVVIKLARHYLWDTWAVCPALAAKIS